MQRGAAAWGSKCGLDGDVTRLYTDNLSSVIPTFVETQKLSSHSQRAREMKRQATTENIRSQSTTDASF
jgi:hypothetical protein